MIPHFYGLDIHQQYVVAAAVDRSQHVCLQPTRIPMDQQQTGRARARGRHGGDRGGHHAWQVADQLSDHVDRVVVANPYKTKLIAEARIKNDKVDALALAQLLAGDLICDVWVTRAGP